MYQMITKLSMSQLHIDREHGILCDLATLSEINLLSLFFFLKVYGIISIRKVTSHILHVNIVIITLHLYIIHVF